MYAIFAGKEASITALFCSCISHRDKKIQTEVIISGFFWLNLVLLA